MEPQKNLLPTGFPANINNLNSTSEEPYYFDNSSDKLSGIEIIKNEYFIIVEPDYEEPVVTQSFY